MEKKDAIKHKLWGRLKKKAHDFYEVRPSKDNEFYEIWRPRYPHEDWFKSDMYDWVRQEGLLDLDEAREIVEDYRENLFWKLCNEALYGRRMKKVRNL